MVVGFVVAGAIIVVLVVALVIVVLRMRGRRVKSAPLLFNQNTDGSVSPQRAHFKSLLHAWDFVVQFLSGSRAAQETNSNDSMQGFEHSVSNPGLYHGFDAPDADQSFSISHGNEESVMLSDMNGDQTRFGKKWFHEERVSGFGENDTDV
jgi:hypothetical protein